MIDRYLVRYFLAVVDQGTFTAAARHCRVSQPTLSIGISRLESSLDRTLFERTNRRVELTAAGTRFLPHARRVEAAFYEAEQALRDDRPTTTIRLGLMTTLPSPWIQTLVTAACASSNERIEIVDARAVDLSAMIGRRRIDAAIGLRTDASHAGSKIFEEGYALALPANHRLASSVTVGADAVAGETMLVRRDCEALGDISHYFISRGIRPFMAARTSDEGRAVAFVRSGLGITVMPRSFATDGVVMVGLAGFAKTRAVGLSIGSEQPDLLERSGALSRVVDALRLLSSGQR